MSRNVVKWLMIKNIRGYSNERGVVPFPVLIAVLGVLIFLGVSSLATFKSGPFNNFYDKIKSSFASESATSDLIEVPDYYQNLYTYIQTQLNGFQITLNSLNTGQSYPVTFATDLVRANGNSGASLLQPNLYPHNTCPNGYVSTYLTMCSVSSFLDQMQKLGISGMHIAIKYPLFSPTLSSMETGSNEGTSQQYIDFYKEVAAAVRSHGMKIAAEEGAIFAGTGFSQFKYTMPSFCTYEKENNIISQTIIDNIHPDYLNILEEPDTEYTLTNFSQFDPKNGGSAAATRYVNYVLGNASDSECPNNSPIHLNKTTLLPGTSTSITTIVSAGTGTWLMVDRTAAKTNYIQSFAQIPNLDAIDMHIYPVVNDNPYNFLQNALTISDTAHNAGKRVTMSQAWDTKEDSSAFSTTPNVGGVTEVFNNDVFSFWAPLDQQMMSELYLMSKEKNIELVSPVWSDFFLAYLTYNPGVYDENSNYQTLSSAINSMVSANLTNSTFSSTGLYVKNLLTAPTPILTITPTATLTSVPVTSTPTVTPTATRTPTPTNTSIPTNTPSPTPISVPGDINGDSIVNLIDLSLMLSNFNLTVTSSNRASDLNDDSSINSADFSLIITDLKDAGVI